MAERGLCSRREADNFIEQGLVIVDGVVVNKLGTKIYRTQSIEVAQSARNQQSRLVTVLINKPPGYVSGLPEKGYQSAVMLINRENAYHRNQKPPNRAGLAPAGRLDIDSTGLMVFTQDGRVARKLIAPDGAIEKEYSVRVTGAITTQKLQQLEQMRELDGKPLKPVKTVQVGKDQIRFILTEGKKRQIRRMCEQCGLKAVNLTRIRIGQVSLGDLPRGKWRLLGTGESF